MTKKRKRKDEGKFISNKRGRKIRDVGSNKKKETKDEYEIEEILEKRKDEDGKIQYRVKWVGWSRRHNSWVKEEDIHADELIARYHARQEKKTGRRGRNEAV